MVKMTTTTAATATATATILFPGNKNNTLKIYFFSQKIKENLELKQSDVS